MTGTIADYWCSRTLVSLLMSVLWFYCAGQEICNNGLDDDQDGLIDCYDPDCCGNESCLHHFYSPCDEVECESFTESDFVFDTEELWSLEHVLLQQMPVVGDVDGDGVPELITVVGGSVALLENIFVQWLFFGYVAIVDTKTGEIRDTFHLPVAITSYGENGVARCPISVADVDSDGTSEIFVFWDNRLFRLEHDGAQLVSEDQDFNGDEAGPITLVDFDGDGEVEVLTNHAIFRAEDLSLIMDLPNSHNTEFGLVYERGHLSMPIDIWDDDACSECGGMELLLSNVLYSVDLESQHLEALDSLQYPNANATIRDISIADIDGDGTLEAILNSPPDELAQARIYIFDIETCQFMRQIVDFSGEPDRFYGPPTISDVDGDGELEIVCLAKNRLQSFGLNTTEWTNVLDFEGADYTACSSFDFDGDGDNEIVAAGQDGWIVVDGSTGQMIHRIPGDSVSGSSVPLIVDVNGDGLTELLLMTYDSELPQWDTTYSTYVPSGGAKIICYTSGASPWAATRPLWNQYHYFPSAINDDLSVPVVQQQPHIVGDSTKLNTYRNQLVTTKAPDAIIDILQQQCPLGQTITYEICNQGDLVLSCYTPIVFYDGNPLTSEVSVVGVDTLGLNLPSGTCTTKIIELLPFGDTLYAIVNDDQSVGLPYHIETDFPMTNISECNYFNNIDFVSRDAPILTELNLEICPGDSVFIHDEFQTTSGVYVDTIALNPECDSISMVTLNVTPFIQTIDYIQTCAGIEVIVHGVSIGETGVYTDTISLADNCDSISIVELLVSPPLVTSDRIDVCFGESALVHGEITNESGVYIDTFSTVAGCDSISSVDFRVLEYIETYEEVRVCESESALIHGQVQTESGTYVESFEAVSGCDSISIVDLIVIGPLASHKDSFICPGLSLLVDGTVYYEGDTVVSLTQSVDGCDSLLVIYIREWQDYSFSMEYSDSLCPGENDGFIQVLGGQNESWEYSLDSADFQSQNEWYNLPPGHYDIYVRDRNGCVQMDSLEIESIEPLQVEAINPAFDCDDDSVTLGVEFISGSRTELSYLWSNGETSSSVTVEARPSSHSVIVSNICETLDLDFMLGGEEFESLVYAPNVFSPNGDGVNDEFTLFVVPDFELEYFQLKVYDRWGMLLFHSQDVQQGWDGTWKGEALSNQVLVWHYQIQGRYCQEFIEIERYGDLTLLR